MILETQRAGLCPSTPWRPQTKYCLHRYSKYREGPKSNPKDSNRKGETTDPDWWGTSPPCQVPYCSAFLEPFDHIDPGLVSWPVPPGTTPSKPVNASWGSGTQILLQFHRDHILSHVHSQAHWIMKLIYVLNYKINLWKSNPWLLERKES